MEYYRITQRKDIRNCIRPPFMTQTEIWSRTEPVFVPGIVKNPGETVNFLPIYETNVFLISSQIRSIWEYYQRGGRYRSCAFGSVEQRLVQAHCFMIPPVLEVVHPDTEYGRNGEMAELCLDREKVGTNKVFGISDTWKIHLIISRDVLEEMLERKIVGFWWEEVKVK